MGEGGWLFENIIKSVFIEIFKLYSLMNRNAYFLEVIEWWLFGKNNQLKINDVEKKKKKSTEIKIK